MSRPKIICHMHTLLNGKIDGIANPTDIGMRSQKLYFDLMLGKDRYYSQHRGWISGTGTSRAFLAMSPLSNFPNPPSPCQREITLLIPMPSCIISPLTGTAP